MNLCETTNKLTNKQTKRYDGGYVATKTTNGMDIILYFFIYIHLFNSFTHSHYCIFRLHNIWLDCFIYSTPNTNTQRQANSSFLGTLMGLDRKYRSIAQIQNELHCSVFRGRAYLQLNYLYISTISLFQIPTFSINTISSLGKSHKLIYYFPFSQGCKG